MTRARRSDTLPEHRAYMDTGCKWCPSCLSCTLECCFFELPKLDQQRYSRRHRARKIGAEA